MGTWLFFFLNFETDMNNSPIYFLFIRGDCSFLIAVVHHI